MVNSEGEEEVCVTLAVVFLGVVGNVCSAVRSEEKVAARAKHIKTKKKTKKSRQRGVSFLAPKRLLLLHVRTARAQRSDVLCKNLTVVASKVSNPHLYLKFGITFKLDSIQSYAGCCRTLWQILNVIFFFLVLSVDVLM